MRVIFDPSASDNKIKMIKAWRALTGVGLKEAKEQIESGVATVELPVKSTNPTGAALMMDLINDHVVKVTGAHRKPFKAVAIEPDSSGIWKVFASDSYHEYSVEVFAVQPYADGKINYYYRVMNQGNDGVLKPWEALKQGWYVEPVWSVKPV